MNTLRRPTARIILVAGLLLLGACGSSGGSGDAKTTTTKVKTTTTRPGKVPRPAVAAYCAKVKANKGKFNLKTRASAALSATFTASILKGAPSQIAQELRTMAAAMKELAAAPTDAAFTVRQARFSTPEVQKAYGRITFFGVRACKFPK